MKKIFLFGFIVFFVCCEKNHAPLIQSVTCTPESRKPGTIFSLSVQATDQDGDLLKYSWVADGGVFIDSANLNQTKWKSPLEASGKTYNIEVSVNDGSTSVNAKYIIKLAVNNAPVITDLRSYPVTDVGGTEFAVKVIAHDPENDPLTYVWSCMEGEFTDGKDRSLARWQSPVGNLDKTYSLSLEISDGINKIDTILQIPVLKSPGGSLSGYTWFFGTSIYIAGVTMNIAGKSALSDSTGHFEINDIPSGTYSAEAIKADYSALSKEIIISSGITTNTNFYLSSQRYTGKAFGVVKDQDGEIIDGALILMLNPDQTESEIKVTSNSQGNYELSSIPLGNRALIVRKEATQISTFESKQVDVLVSNQDTPLDFILQKASLVPVVITQPVKRVSYNFSASGGDVTYDGQSPILKRGVCWSLSSNPQVADNKTSNGSGTGPFESSLTGLAAGTTYYIRAYATNSFGNTGYGEVISMTTLQTGSLTDSRDQKTYKTVDIGSQTWMAENLNYSAPSGSWCYEDKASYCTQAGHLYDFNRTINVGSGKDVCPTGWQVPTDAEWTLLIEFLGTNPGYQLKASSGWTNNGNGDNSSGFNGKPGGMRQYDGTYDGFNDFIPFWATSSGQPKTVVLSNSGNQVFISDASAGSGTAYIRCLKN